MSESQRGNRKTLTGLVTSDKMDKTVVVEVIKRVTHKRYKKIVSRRVKYKAHDEGNQCGIGDKVVIVESRPYSKNKRWRVQKILTQAL